MRFAVALLVTAAIPASAQFGGILNKARSKVQETQTKAKPVTDRAERVASLQPWTAEEEQQIGRATAEKMVAMFGIVEDPNVVRYVNLVGSAVARQASRKLPYRFGVLKSEIVGAFALPGGYIFITQGAVAQMENEAQLAGALGHEVVHTADRHLETEIRSKRGSAWAIQEANTSRLATPDAIKLRADAFLNDLFNTSLSKDKEDASDRGGATLAAKAGYAANGLLVFIEKLSTVSKKEENKRLFGQVLSTHPSFDSRIATLAELSKTSGDKGLTLEARFRGVVPR
ncbi:MAG: M48 family metalloprotease [Bryobacteraceae bacterium]